VILPLIEELSKNGVTFTVAYMLEPEDLKDDYNRLGAKTVRLGKNPFKILNLLVKIIFDKQTPVSIIHTHLVHASLIGRFLGRLLGIPVMTTRHYRERNKKKNLLYLLEDITSKYSQRVIAISNSVHGHLLDSNYVSPERCKMIYNPIDLKIFAGSQYTDISKRHKIVFNGRFIELKGMKYLLEAFASVAPVLEKSQLVLMGRFEENDPILELIEKHEFRDRIRIKGFVQRAEIIAELEHARVYVQPSLSEGLGLAALEAMGLKCPCIFSAVGGLVELAQEGKNAILFPARNSERLAEAILDLWGDIKKSERLGTHAAKFVVNNFDSVKIAQEYYNQYEILEERRAQ